MAVTSKQMTQAKLVIMLDAAFNPSAITQQFEVYTSEALGAQIKKGESTAGNLYAAAGTGSGNASVALSANVVITVNAGSTGNDAVAEIRCIDSTPSILYYIGISPSEEFLYEGTMTITTATITINVAMT